MRKGWVILPQLPIKQSKRLIVEIRQAPVPFVAIVGLGPEIAWTVTAIRRRSTRLAEQMKQVHLFHWQDMGILENELTHYRPQWLKGRRPRGGPKATWLERARKLVTQHPASDGTRSRWEEVIEKQVELNLPRYTTVIHLGDGRAEDIWGDLDVLDPMCSDETTIILCHMDRIEVQAHFRRMVTKMGWSGLPRGDMAILMRLPIVPVVKEIHDGSSSFAQTEALGAGV